MMAGIWSVWLISPSPGPRALSGTPLEHDNHFLNEVEYNWFLLSSPLTLGAHTEIFLLQKIQTQNNVEKGTVKNVSSGSFYKAEKNSEVLSDDVDRVNKKQQTLLKHLGKCFSLAKDYCLPTGPDIFFF